MKTLGGVAQATGHAGIVIKTGAEISFRLPDGVDRCGEIVRWEASGNLRIRTPEGGDFSVPRGCITE